jgi:hypothetical protein
MRGGLSGLRVASFSGKAQRQWQSARQNGAKRRIEPRSHSLFSLAAAVFLRSFPF